jgi:2-iminobutanoate/2-iminopropanoate deaminase
MSKQIINTSGAPAPIGPYSQATLSANGMLFVSGQIALDPQTGQLINSDIHAETQRVMENIVAIVTAADMTMNDVLKCTIFLKDMNDFAKVNETYGAFFPSDPPARETVQVSRLPKDVNVEISVIAGK